MDTEIWVVIGSGMSWGKGHSFTEALHSMLKNDTRTYPAKAMHVYRITGDDQKWTDIAVEGMGGVS